MKELTFMPETMIRQKTKIEIDKHFDDLKLLRGFYLSQRDVDKSLEVLNWPYSKVKNYAYVLRGR